MSNRTVRTGISLLLMIAWIAAASTALAASRKWICPECGRSMSGNFCNNCGAAKPSSGTTETVSVKLSSGRTVTVRKSVKEALDSYESFMKGYKDAMDGLSNGNYSGYMSFLSKQTEFMEKIENMEDDFTDDETWYYLEVSTRILQLMY